MWNSVIDVCYWRPYWSCSLNATSVTGAECERLDLHKRTMKKITYALATLVVLVVLSRYTEYIFTQNGLHSAWPTFSGVDKDTVKVSDGGTQGTVFFGWIWTFSTLHWRSHALYWTFYTLNWTFCTLFWTFHKLCWLFHTGLNFSHIALNIFSLHGTFHTLHWIVHTLHWTFHPLHWMYFGQIVVIQSIECIIQCKKHFQSLHFMPCIE